MELLEKTFDETKDKIDTLQRDKEGTFFAWLLDEEGDLFKVIFNYDECAQLFTDCNWTTLSKYNLSLILQMIEETEFIYNSEK